jgi:hypothetical protein
VDFLVVRIGAGDIPALLAAAPDRGEPASDPARFAGLFDGPDLAADVEEQFDDALAINSVLLIQDVFIDAAVRGHRLGPWTLAEIIHRIADVTNDLVVMSPHICELVVPTIWDNMEELSEHAYRYWQDQLNLEPIAGGFLGQATAFTHLENARRALDDVYGSFITVDTGALALRRANNDTDLWPIRAPGGQPAEKSDIAQQPHDQSGQRSEPVWGSPEYHLRALRRIVSTVDKDDETAAARLSATVSFFGEEDSEGQQAAVFQRAANYFRGHPELAIDTANWTTFEDDDGHVRFALDVGVIPPGGISDEQVRHLYPKADE